MPQTVAAFHSLVGAAAIATAVGEYLHLAPLGLLSPVSIGAIVAATYLGGITTTGSLVAFAKLNGLIGSSPVPSLRTEPRTDPPQTARASTHVCTWCTRVCTIACTYPCMWHACMWHDCMIAGLHVA